MSPKNEWIFYLKLFGIQRYYSKVDSFQNKVYGIPGLQFAHEAFAVSFNCIIGYMQQFCNFPCI